MSDAEERNELEGLDPLSVAKQMWDTKPPSETVEQWTQIAARLRAHIEEARTWNADRWIAERDRDYNQQVREAQEQYDEKQPHRELLTRYMTKLIHLVDETDDEATRADLEKLVSWFAKALQTANERVELPVKLTYQAFGKAWFEKQGAQLRDAEHRIENAKRAWAAYAADQARIARVQAALGNTCS